MLLLTVLFDDPWWIGVVEVHTAAGIQVARWIFGSEPGNAEVYAFVQGEFTRLLDGLCSPVSLDAAEPSVRRRSPKRAAREAARSLRERGISTYAQEALKQQQEAHKQERKQTQRERRKQQADARRAQARQRAKERHRGR